MLFYLPKINFIMNRLQAEEMIDYIKKAFKRNIYKLDWMDNDTRKSAIEKVDRVNFLIHGFYMLY